MKLLPNYPGLFTKKCSRDQSEVKNGRKVIRFYFLYAFGDVTRQVLKNLPGLALGMEILLSREFSIEFFGSSGTFHALL